MLLLKLFIIAITALVTAHQVKEPRVRILHGVLKGTCKISTKGRTYGSFQGIPYARPPLAKFRFREPQPPAPWPGVWDASRPLQPCLQRDAFEKKVIGREDCLHLNVYSPKPYIGAMLPVVVFIHGGTFMHGSGSFYDPGHLMDKDLVVVTFNYRLGPLGFLSTGDEVVPGNAGLKDQTMALRWVRNNILMFGGNPDSVTLAGCSAGGASVHYHYLSPMSRGRI
ncbi:esterase FE4-like [Hyposmocoma kahamanoa]|uniref:esterase FE4-like n=1 Tax=Hyposmocoma kahamanoa TaxID=1477025 RepID=UPI000E6D861D|nr:esterase FE4-like [Hyposmocoma kahamanoa]